MHAQRRGGSVGNGWRATVVITAVRGCGRLRAWALRLAWLSVALAGTATATDLRGYDGPDARARSYGANYKDRIFALCLGRAYRSAPEANQDIMGTAALLLDWTYYDVEAASSPMMDLLGQYQPATVATSYISAPTTGTGSGLMKCLQLYHSAELDAQVRRFVADPARSYIEDHPAADGRDR